MTRLLSLSGFALLLVATLVSAGAGLLLGSSSSVAAWAEAVCPPGATVVEGTPDEEFRADFGAVDAYARCQIGDRDSDRVEAFVAQTDPARELLNTGDGWESGDGTGVTWAIKDLGGDWAVVLAVGEGFDTVAFEALQDEGFEVHSNPSSPLEGYDDYYGG